MMMMLRFLIVTLVFMLLNCCTVRYKEVGVASDGQAYAHQLSSAQKESIAGLTQAITQLGANVNPREAADVAYNAVVYPMYLSNKYQLVWPPSLQNIFVNAGVKERGLCYQWARDMLAHLRSHEYQTLDFVWTISNRATKDEHNSAVVIAKGDPWQKGILLDPWRNSGNLYWQGVMSDPKYKWTLYEKDQ
jgi:hypothetical protein